MKFNECECEDCQAACEFKPGWFMPGQIEKLAEHMNISVQTLFEEYLGVDWYAGENELNTGNEDIFVISPAIEFDMEPGNMFPGNPKGICVFYTLEGKCEIHSENKPFECKEYHHTTSRDTADDWHEVVAKAWKPHQEQIKKLLGREPESEEFEGGGLFGLW